MQPYPRPVTAWWGVGVLFVAYTVSFIDRVLIGLLVEPIKADLTLSDTQFALLQGMAFALLYAVMGLPFGWLADRASRRIVIAAGSVVWSLSTAACGLAGSFGQLLAARIGVGAGEASLSPCAVAIIADSFPPARRSLAMSVYTAASSVGAGAALIGGGAIVTAVMRMDMVALPAVGALAPWQATFMIAGLGGLLVSVLAMTIPEPGRRGPAGPARWAGESLRAHLWRHRRCFGPFFGAIVLYTAMAYGLLAWIPAFFIRTYGMTPGEAGLRYGLVLLVFGGAGGPLGAWLAGRLTPRDRSADLVLSAAAAAAVAPLFVLAFSRATAGAALLWLTPALLVYTMPGGLAVAAVQAAVPAARRGMTAAIYYLLIGLVGMTAGPLLVALLSDHLFGAAQVGRSLATAAALLAPPSAALLWMASRPIGRLAEAQGLAAAG